MYGLGKHTKPTFVTYYKKLYTLYIHLYIYIHLGGQDGVVVKVSAS